MGKLELSQIKLILQNTSSEIKTVQEEVKRDHGNISDIKIEKLQKSLEKSTDALTELKSLNVSESPSLETGEIQKLIDTILTVRKGKGPINPSILQAVLSSLQKLNTDLNEIRIDKDDRLGRKVEGINKSKQS